MLTTDSWSLPQDVWLTGGGSTAIDATAAPSSVLDVGGIGAGASNSGWGAVNSSLSNLLDAYTKIETAKINAAAVPAANTPVQYLRVPGTATTVPAGTSSAGSSSGGGLLGGMSLTTILIIGAVIFFAVKKS